uniref:Uncharacterized protein n=1 Tax=Heliothis virescens TaxID=7102 RepID=A0A2A4JTD7_HELVI
MAAMGGGDEPPFLPPYAKVRPNLVEWIESIFEDCMLYDRTIFCSCNLCERQISSGGHVMTCSDPHFVEVKRSPDDQFSYIGFLNARREAAIQRDFDRMEAEANGGEQAGEELVPETEADDADDPQADDNNTESEEREPNKIEEPVDDLYRNA